MILQDLVITVETPRYLVLAKAALNCLANANVAEESREKVMRDVLAWARRDIDAALEELGVSDDAL